MTAHPATRALVATASIQVLAGIAGFFWGEPEPARFPLWLGVLMILCFSAGGWLLLLGGRADPRAVHLGVALLLVAAAYSERFVEGLEATLPRGWSGLAGFLGAVGTRDFLPLYLALFARSFPESRLGAWTERAIDRTVQLLGFLGGGLAIASFWAWMDPREPFFTLAKWEEGGGFLILGIVPLVLALLKTGHATGVERRRARVFLFALVLGFGPILLQILLEALSPAYHGFSHRPGVELAYQIVLLSCLASLPFTTAYAVLVHKVLDVRLLARRALQYALARYSTVFLALVPFAFLCSFLVQHRDDTLAHLFTGSRLAVLLAATALGALAMRYRQPVLEYVDRRFFREQYDARQLLTVLVEQIRASSNQASLADLIAHGVDRALHLETVAVLATDAEVGRLTDPLGKVRSLDPSSSLGTLVAAASEPLEVDLEAPRSPARRLPEEDRHWVADGGFHLLVPLLSTDGQLLGLIALGGKKSGLPFLREDRQLLATIARTAALALEVRVLRRQAPGEEAAAPEAALPTAAGARECLECGRLFLPATTLCSRCGISLETAAVPYVVPGKFRFERRLGAGGMGVVYLAVDLALGRPVAIKTLRRMSPEDAMRLRREARTAATVSHPNLAFVFGVETWSGTPMLIFEFLEGGTLSERLAGAALDSMEAVELGIAMAGALERLHEAEILHRDVKPSNIGYARDGTPKLMDFGIARARFDTREDSGNSSGGAVYESLGPTLIWGQVTDASSQRLVGTLSYLPPEAFEGAHPGPTFDLWSLNLVLYECLTASRVFDGDDVGAVVRAIRHEGVPDVRRHRPDCPAVLADLFGRNLSRQGSRRAASARDLRLQLEEVRRKLLA